jgi:hypothetical protein
VASLLAAAQVLKESAARLLVRRAVVINALMADRGMLFQREPAGDLFRTPSLTKVVRDQRPWLKLKAQSAVLEAALLGFLLCLLRALATPASIARELARDSRGMNANLGSALKL